MPQPVTLTAAAPAKINLSLDILGKREDGYHNLKMVMASVSLYDDLTLTFTPCEAGCEVFSASDSNNALPDGEKNLAVRAARLFMEEAGLAGRSVHIHIIKRIPVCAGLGGGSSDAAAVLRALNKWHSIPQETLAALALSLGSDVPYCLRGGVCLAEGRGEVLSPLPPLPDWHIVLTVPPVAVNTAEAFSRLGAERIEGGRLFFNAFEEKAPECVAEVKSILLEMGAENAVMSGTGSAVLGVFDDETLARKAYKNLLERFPNTFLVKPV